MENTTLKVQLGSNIATLRIKAGLSKSALALISGVSRAYLVAIESGAANPTVDVLNRIANGLNTSVGALFEKA